MDSRTAVWLSTFVLALTGAGCITTQTQPASPVANPAVAPTRTPAEEQAAKAKKDAAPKRNPQPRTEVAYGQLKESDAESDASKTNPEFQALLRDQARQAYQHAIKLDPTYVDAYRHLGRLYAKIGDFDRAFDIYKKAMALQPKDATLWFALGECHNRRKDFDEAVRCFQRALEFDPENRDYLKKLGFTLAWMGQVPQGLTYLTRAQGSAMAHYNIGRVLLERGQKDQAQVHLTLAVRENPQLEPNTRDLLASLQTAASPATQRDAAPVP